ncbi:hypothetical protein UPYG_G00057750, partial [Umbra pygmaea]
ENRPRICPIILWCVPSVSICSISRSSSISITSSSSSSISSSSSSISNSSISSSSGWRKTGGMVGGSGWSNLVEWVE